MGKILWVIALAVWGFSLVGHLRAQTGSGALVVSACGTLPKAYPVGSTRQVTVNTNGQVCQ